MNKLPIKKITRTSFIILLTIVTFSCNQSHPKEVKNSLKSEKENRQAYYREFYNLRVEDDQETFSHEQLEQIEKQYGIANKIFNTTEAITILDSLVNNNEFKGANRIGCSLLYLGQMSKKEKKKKYLLTAKSDYSNSWYGDGVNVGAYATYELYFYYKYIGNENEAKKYKSELLNKYANYINHSQTYFKDILSTENK